MRPPRKRPAEGDAPFHETTLWGLGGFVENMANSALVSLAGLFCRERYAGRKQEKIRLGLAVRETLRNRAFAILLGALFGNHLPQWCGVRGEIDPTAGVLTLAPEVVERLRWAYALTPALCLAGAARFICRHPHTRRQSEQTPEPA